MSSKQRKYRKPQYKQLNFIELFHEIKQDYVPLQLEQIDYKESELERLIKTIGTDPIDDYYRYYGKYIVDKSKLTAEQMALIQM